MQIVIEIPDEDVPNKQEIIDIDLHFIAGEVCECSYPYIVLPKGHEQALEAAKIIRDYCNSFPLMSCKGCVFDRVTGCTLKNPTDFPETWELNDKIYPKDDKEVD